MAYYEHLPIYRKAMETAVYFENIVRNFSRYNKYNLGAEMRTKSRKIISLIIKANSSREQLPVLYELREQLEEFKVLIRISKERGGHLTFELRYRFQPAWGEGLQTKLT
ncbi:MAG: four helix bundle protein [bacterium]|nr:four helix bundle protein [bacterium]